MLPPLRFRIPVTVSVRPGPTVNVDPPVRRRSVTGKSAEVMAESFGPTLTDDPSAGTNPDSQFADMCQSLPPPPPPPHAASVYLPKLDETLQPVLRKAPPAYTSGPATPIAYTYWSIPLP